MKQPKKEVNQELKPASYLYNFEGTLPHNRQLFTPPMMPISKFEGPEWKFIANGMNTINIPVDI